MTTCIFVGCKTDNKTDLQTLKEEGGSVLEENTFSNPILLSGADPWTIYHEGNYYYIKSGNNSISAKL